MAARIGLSRAALYCLPSPHQAKHFCGPFCEATSRLVCSVQLFLYLSSQELLSVRKPPFDHEGAKARRLKDNRRHSSIKHDEYECMIVQCTYLVLTRYSGSLDDCGSIDEGSDFPGVKMSNDFSSMRTTLRPTGADYTLGLRIHETKTKDRQPDIAFPIVIILLIMPSTVAPYFCKGKLESYNEITNSSCDNRHYLRPLLVGGFTLLRGVRCTTSD